MKLMEVLTREQGHLITESYTLDSSDGVRLSIIQESYDRSLIEYRRSVSEYSKNSRQAHVAESKLQKYTELYNNFVVEMDQYYGKNK
jgi:hypothetical protein